MRIAGMVSRVLGVAAVFLVSSASNGQTFAGLGVLPTGTFSYATAVSGDGLVVVGYADAYDYTHPQQPSSVYRPFRWTTTGGFEDLGTTLWGWSGWAYAVNQDGSVVVGAVYEDGDFVGVLWRACGARQLIGPSTPLQDLQSYCYGISRDGSVAVGTVGQRAFRWTQPEGRVFLNSAAPFNAGGSEGLAVSGNGLVAVGRSDWTSPTLAFRWNNESGMVSLGAWDSNNKQANAVNDDGTVVVGRTGTRAFRWTAQAGAQDLGTLGGNFANARGVSSDGSVVVGDSSDSGAVNYPFRWTQNDGMSNLNSLLHGLGLAEGWSLERVTGVSADGLTIVGVGWHNGHDEGWIATLGVGPNTPGACCRGSTCAALLLAECAGSGGLFTAAGVACNAPSNSVAPCCRANFNLSNGLTVQDVFDYLNAWFAGSANARFSSRCGLAVQDIFDFLAAWFAGCN